MVPKYKKFKENKYISKNIDEGQYDFKDPTNGVSVSNIEESLEINKRINLNNQKGKKEEGNGENNTKNKKKCC